jgi:cob(I)alamin adenosyltransferase|tara:strand:- start:299 stop:451 length:153 start_codon:yes stop_codon:yes gene_type:complete
MGDKRKIPPKQIKFLERMIDDVKRKDRPIRAEVMPTTVPAWGLIKEEKGE